MSRLTDEELLEIQVFIDRARDELHSRGLTIEVDTDLSKWVRLLRNAPKADIVASTHDPSKSNVHPGNSFWVVIREQQRSIWDRLLRREAPIIACLCHRVVETESIIEEMRTQRLFFDRKPILDYKPIEITATNMPLIGGKVGVAGGFWVHPHYRGTKLSNIVSRVTRILSLRHFDIDWSVSLVRDTPRRKAMIHNTYGLSHSASVSRGYYPPYNTELDMQMSYMHRSEMLAQVKSENAKAAPERQSEVARQEESDAAAQQEAKPPKIRRWSVN
ncbi:MAG: hypothetical protein MJE12_29005 [Alphaproteobacteria bacterium]|nr:hypothetical protein [Alphaproteobacteria bacterium]